MSTRLREREAGDIVFIARIFMKWKGLPMKTLLFLAALLVFVSPGCRAAEQPSVERQELEIALVPAKHLLTGVGTMTVIPGKSGGIGFSLSPRATVERVTLEGKEVSFRFEGGELSVPLPQGNRPLRLVIDWRAIFDDKPRGDATSTEDASLGVSGVISEEGAFLGSGSGWYPDPSVLPARRLIAVSAPAPMRAVTSGHELSTETRGGVTVSRWETDLPLSYLSLAAGAFDVRQRSVDGITLSTWLYGDDAELSKRYLDAVEGYFGYYRGLLGPYPFRQFAVVENFIPTGYGFPSYTLIGGNILRLPFILTTSLPHEFVHSWWGNGVYPDYRKGNWSEGLTTYLADYLQEERKSPAAARAWRMKAMTDFASLVTPESDMPLSAFRERSDSSSRAVGYGKGAMIFHLLRTCAGDDAFFKGLRRVAKERMFKEADWDDFARAIGREAGRNVVPLMDELVSMKGGITLEARNVTTAREGDGWRVRGEIVQRPLVSPIPVTLRLETAGKPLETTVEVGNSPVPFSFTAKERPQRLLIDPESNIFRKLSISELPPTVNRLKSSRNLIAVIASSYRGDADSPRHLLRSLGREDVEQVKEENVTAESLAGRDVIVFGAPKKPLLPQLPEGFSLSGDSFTADGTVFRDPGDLLVMVTGSAGRVATLFLPLSAEAAKKGEAKPTHYGAYSWLVFAHGENRLKGTFKSAADASVIDLSPGKE